MTENLDKLCDSAIQKLAELPSLQYDQVRKAEAKTLGVRTETLDAAVKMRARKAVTTTCYFLRLFHVRNLLTQQCY